MGVHVIKQGLDLPISGGPTTQIDAGDSVTTVALTAGDYPLMKPRMHVEVGDTVKRGQRLFEDRKADGVNFTSPGAGTVVAVNRGARRVLLSVVIELSEADRAGNGEAVTFENFSGGDIGGLSDDAVRALLSESGLWSALRTRPFGKVPALDDTASAIFVTAMDTNPLSGSVDHAIAGREDDLVAGLAVVAKLTTGKTYLCKAAGSKIPGAPGVHVEEFGGKHPAGLPGTHIHMLDPVSRSKIAWHLDWQDVVAIGRLFQTGTMDFTRVVAIGGPAAKNPRMVRTRCGARLSELLANELVADVDVRTISGSILSGRAIAHETEDYLGRYHSQVSCLAEDRERALFGWLMPGFNKFSTIRTFASRWFGLGKKTFPMTTTSNGSHRAMVPIGMFERVMPLDIMPTFLLRSLVVGDLETAEKLGCLELAEEDLALCTFVSPGKEDFGKALRRNLDEIWKEG
jgi:Na+-transporting NADH:ubiquinone oxidoreductase subunit A